MNTPVKIDLRDESGFTLSELLVVLGLLGVVLAVAWAGLYGIRMGNQVASQEGDAAIAFGDPMEQMSTILMQNTSIRSTDANRVEVWTDRNLDGQPELNAFYVNSAGQLIHEYWLYNTARSAYTQHRVRTMSEANSNVSQGVPLFTYFTRNGAELTGADVTQKGPSDSVFVRVRMSVGLNGRHEVDTRDIYFRTRS